jgi:hypothetical protein
MAPRRRAAKATLAIGEGARCSVEIRYLRPSQVVAEAFINADKDYTLEDLIAVERKVILRKGKPIKSYFFRSPSLPGLVSCAEKWATVLEQGEHFLIWDEPGLAPSVLTPPATNEAGEEIADFVFQAQNRAEDIALVRAMGFEVDDDDEPAPENIPADDERLFRLGGDLHDGQEWGWDGIDQRAGLLGGMYHQPTFANSWSPQGKSFVDIFLHLFPVRFVETVMVEATSRVLMSDNLVRTTIGEMLRYIGMWLLMSCYMKPPEYFWRPATRTTTILGDDSEDEENDTPSFTFNRYMSQRRFLAITVALRFTASTPPTFCDKFWEIRDLITSWNALMKDVFSAAWAVCLDESMSIWHSRWTCPGWVFCPRKPHPFGNKYHTACCGLSGAMFSMEMVEGKDHPPQIKERFSELGKTTGLLMRMLECYFATGRYVILDSGFCVLKALVELKKVGLFACAMIEKRRYWPAKVPGDAMTDAFDEAQVGDSRAISGVLDGVKYFLWGLKEPNCVMKMMATGGPLISNDSCKMQRRTWTEAGLNIVKSFQFPLPYDWHYKYRHAVDDHNNLRHSLPSIEHTITTTRWEMRVFSFVLAVSEVNAFLAYRFFCRPDSVPTLQQFRHKLAWQLIKNRFLIQEESAEQNVVHTVHQLMNAPPHATKFQNGVWICNASQRYQNYPCTVKRCGETVKRCKTYCSCTPGKWICKYCHGGHVVAELKCVEH